MSLITIFNYELRSKTFCIVHGWLTIRERMLELAQPDPEHRMGNT